MKKKIEGREISTDNEIKLFLHCRKCFEEIPEGMSASEYQSISVGWTELGLQVWCDRHNLNIIHIDFEGMKHPATLKASRKRTEIVKFPKRS